MKRLAIVLLVLMLAAPAATAPASAGMDWRSMLPITVAAMQARQGDIAGARETLALANSRSRTMFEAIGHALAGDAERALASLDTLESGERRDALGAVGMLLSRFGDRAALDRVTALITDEIQSSEDSPGDMLEFGLIFAADAKIRAGDVESAIRTVAPLGDGQASRSLARHVFAMSLVEQGDLDGAIELAAGASDRGSGLAKMLAFRALILGEVDEAFDLFLRLPEVWGFDGILLLVAEARAAEGDVEGAIAAARAIGAAEARVLAFAAASSALTRAGRSGPARELATLGFTESGGIEDEDRRNDALFQAALLFAGGGDAGSVREAAWWVTDDADHETLTILAAAVSGDWSPAISAVENGYHWGGGFVPVVPMLLARMGDADAVRSLAEASRRESSGLRKKGYFNLLLVSAAMRIGDEALAIEIATGDHE